MFRAKMYLSLELQMWLVTSTYSITITSVLHFNNHSSEWDYAGLIHFLYRVIHIPSVEELKKKDIARLAIYFPSVLSFTHVLDSITQSLYQMHVS